MTKALSLSLFVIVGLIVGTGSAWADKPKIAVLGLEVVPGPGGSVDPATTAVAREVTKELRARAQAGSSPYMIAPNSNKELTDEKLLLSCDNEGKDCMAVIGAGLAADMLMFGRVEKRGENYRVTLKLLDVKTKGLEVRNDEMPIGGSVANVSKRLYGKLIVDVGASTINVIARGDGRPVDGGRVLVDEEKAGELTAGKLTIGGVSEGRHTVAIEAGGFRRFEQTITVRAGQPAKVDATLVTRDGGAPVASTGGASKFWKVTLGVSLGVTAAAGALTVAGYLEENKYSDSAKSGVSTADLNARGTPDHGKCSMSDAEIMTMYGNQMGSYNAKAFRSACNWYKVHLISSVVTGVAGAVAVTSLIMVLLDHGKEKQSGVAIAPILTPNEAGASLSLRW